MDRIKLHANTSSFSAPLLFKFIFLRATAFKSIFFRALNRYIIRMSFYNFTMDALEKGANITIALTDFMSWPGLIGLAFVCVVIPIILKGNFMLAEISLRSSASQAEISLRSTVFQQ